MLPLRCYDAHKNLGYVNRNQHANLKQEQDIITRFLRTIWQDIAIAEAAKASVQTADAKTGQPLCEFFRLGSYVIPQCCDDGVTLTSRALSCLSVWIPVISWTPQVCHKKGVFAIGLGTLEIQVFTNIILSHL